MDVNKDSTPFGVPGSLFSTGAQLPRFNFPDAVKDGGRLPDPIRDGFQFPDAFRTNAILEQVSSQALAANRALEELAQPATLRFAETMFRSVAPAAIDCTAHIEALMDQGRPKFGTVNPPSLPSFREPPLPYVETDDPDASDLEDRVEALEAEKQALVSRCEALERELAELKMRRRTEILDASVEHKPDPPVIDSQFPDN